MKRYLTDNAGQFVCTSVHPAPTPTTPEMRLVKLYPDIKFQQVVGFGAALTESAGYVYEQMSREQRQRFIELCFGESGNRYSLARTSIQSCDFSLAPRSYLDDPSDTELESFSVVEDYGYVIPLALDALHTNPGVEFLASPWSPPAWAKSNRSMKRGGHLQRKYYGLWAKMIARYVADYRAIGIPVTRLTMQNEPQATQTWESCLFTAVQEREFLHKHLKPALRELGLGDVKVLAWDHNKESVLERTAAIACDTSAADDLNGIAFHWYSGDHFAALRVVRDVLGPDRELIFTEGCSAYSGGIIARELPQAEHYAHEIIGDLEVGANGFIDWNILLDSHGGPNHVGNFCDAPLMYDIDAADLRVRLPFVYLGHFSRFIARGARRILSSSYTSDLECSAFVNPDGSHVLVALNRTSYEISFRLTWGHGAACRVTKLDAPAHSIQTLVW